MPKAQLQYLTDELNKLREQKLYQKLRVLENDRQRYVFGLVRRLRRGRRQVDGDDLAAVDLAFGVGDRAVDANAAFL